VQRILAGASQNMFRENFAIRNSPGTRPVPGRASDKFQISKGQLMPFRQADFGKNFSWVALVFKRGD
jgi:hypothetical protein